MLCDLAGVRPLDIALASERIRVAEAQLQRAQVWWLPTIQMGTDYFRHDGLLDRYTHRELTELMAAVEELPAISWAM